MNELTKYLRHTTNIHIIIHHYYCVGTNEFHQNFIIYSHLITSNLVSFSTPIPPAVTERAFILKILIAIENLINELTKYSRHPTYIHIIIHHYHRVRILDVEY